MYLIYIYIYILCILIHIIFTRKRKGREREREQVEKEKQPLTTARQNTTPRAQHSFADPPFFSIYMYISFSTQRVGSLGSPTQTIVLLVKRKRHATKLSNAISFFFYSSYLPGIFFFLSCDSCLRRPSQHYAKQPEKHPSAQFAIKVCRVPG